MALRPRRARGDARLGYTLTEMMLVVAILGVVFMMGPTLMVQMTNFWEQTTARSSIERDVRVSLDIINRMARQAQSSTIVIDQVSGQPPWSRIAFTTISGQTITFYQQNNVLYQSIAGSKSVLSKRIGFIAFSFVRTDDTSVISVAITTQAPIYMGRSKALQLSIQKVRIMN